MEEFTKLRKLFDQEQDKYIQSRYLAGASSIKLSRELGRDKSVILSSLRRTATPIHPGGKRRVELFPNEVKFIIDSFNTFDIPITHMSKWFGCSPKVITRIIKASGGVTQKRAGSRHPHWKGGVTTQGNGYLMERVPPSSPYFSMTNSSGYILQHRLVMAQSLGRCLTPTETVHHINGVGIDNRLENLQLIQGKHGKGAAFICADCGSHNIVSAPITPQES